MLNNLYTWLASAFAIATTAGVVISADLTTLTEKSADKVGLIYQLNGEAHRGIATTLFQLDTQQAQAKPSAEQLEPYLDTAEKERQEQAYAEQAILQMNQVQAEAEQPPQN